MLDVGGLETNPVRDVVSRTEDCDLCSHLHMVPFTNRLHQPVGATNAHLDRACVIRQHKSCAAAAPHQFLVLLPAADMGDAFQRDEFKVGGFERRA